MLMTKERWPAIRTLRSWAILALSDAGAARLDAGPGRPLTPETAHSRSPVRHRRRASRRPPPQPQPQPQPQLLRC
jgi:hypothetical protein